MRELASGHSSRDRTGNEARTFFEVIASIEFLPFSILSWKSSILKAFNLLFIDRHAGMGLDAIDEIITATNASPANGQKISGQFRS